MTEIIPSNGLGEQLQQLPAAANVGTTAVDWERVPTAEEVGAVVDAAAATIQKWEADPRRDAMPVWDGPDGPLEFDIYDGGSSDTGSVYIEFGSGQGNTVFGSVKAIVGRMSFVPRLRDIMQDALPQIEAEGPGGRLCFPTTFMFDRDGDAILRWGRAGDMRRTELNAAETDAMRGVLEAATMETLDQE